MSRTFTKLFSSITESTVWCEPHATVRVWIAMLAKADHVGRVFASIPGLANLARVSVEECETAINTFLSPDKYSRTPDFEGRRIEPIDGGWRLLNHAKYRQLRDEESVKESKRRYINDRRAKEREQGVENVEQSRTLYTHAEVEAEAEADKSKAKAKATVRDKPAPTTDAAFISAWALYPKRGGGNSRADALKSWNARVREGEAEGVMAAGVVRYASYIAATGKERTEYVMQAVRFFGTGKHYQADWTPPADPIERKQPGKQLQGLMALEGMKNGMVPSRNHHGYPEIGGPGFGAPAIGGSPAGDGFGLAGSAGQRLALGPGHGRPKDSRGVLDLGPDSYRLAESAEDA